MGFFVFLFILNNFLAFLAVLFGGTFVLLLSVYILRKLDELLVRIVTRARIWRELRLNMCELNENGSFLIFSASHGGVTHGQVVPPPGRCDYEEDCSICLEHMVLNNPKKHICVTPCGHAYHSSCLHEVYSRKITSGTSSYVNCPLCRAETIGAFELEEEVTKNRYYTCCFFSTSSVVP